MESASLWGKRYPFSLPGAPGAGRAAEARFPGRAAIRPHLGGG
ncbi:MAG: hypothetical protein AVDCRST_MAG56-7365 [uncultured Cytophagales bacterium]|uniref:Uncharacterized protein n=1 Tax=uncultured Cytophagales bacterium TaxID=158755 RepID=A0A6J4LIR2_9SPHI|nr:MAG: hypothetical protein AVDCRST_MAG56-7365 [uncultured Cytophagales bacterium]